MANPNFNPTFSSDEIWRGQDTERCITDDLDALEAGVEDLADKVDGIGTDFAPKNHTHTGFATDDHTHDIYADILHGHKEYAPAIHDHDEYAMEDHTHTGFAAEEHTHTEFAPAAHKHGEYAAANHSHSQYAASSHSHGDYAMKSHTHEASDIKHGDNPVLWKGALHMNEAQTAKLSEAVSDQEHGIVLVFSGYDNTNKIAKDVSWSTHFVPKEMVRFNKDGGQVFMTPINSGLSEMGAKYLYVKDKEIGGHGTNVVSGTSASGIKITNINYVLRYVIGV